MKPVGNFGQISHVSPTFVGASLSESGTSDRAISNLTKVRNESSAIFKEGEGIHILSEIYRRVSLQPEEVKSLIRTCSSLRDFIVNSEWGNIKKGKYSRNTDAFVHVCGDKELSLNTCGLNFERLMKIPLDRKNILALLEVYGCKESERTLAMLVNAGILKKKVVENKFDGMDEDTIKTQLIKNKIRSGLSEVKSDEYISEALQVLKSREFIRDWINFGFYVNEKYNRCIEIFGAYIDFRYSDLSDRFLTKVSFRDCDLRYSNFNNASPDKTWFDNARLYGATMYGVRIGYGDAYIEDNVLTRSYFKRMGVSGLTSYDDENYTSSSEGTCEEDILSSEGSSEEDISSSEGSSEEDISSSSDTDE